MELTFNAVTANRTLGKATVRNRVIVDIIQDAIARTELPPAAFDVLQIILFDHPKGRVTFPMKEPKDRIYQIGVGVGAQNFMNLSSEEFAGELVSACRAAVDAAPFDPPLKSGLLACLTNAEG